MSGDLSSSGIFGIDIEGLFNYQSQPANKSLQFNVKQFAVKDYSISESETPQIKVRSAIGEMELKGATQLDNIQLKGQFNFTQLTYDITGRSQKTVPLIKTALEQT